MNTLYGAAGREVGSRAEGIARGRRKRRQKCLGQQPSSITWQRLYSKHEEKHIAALWRTHGPATVSSSRSWAAIFTLTVCFNLTASILWRCLEGHMCIFVMISLDIFTGREVWLRTQSTAKCYDDAHLLFNHVNNKTQWILDGSEAVNKL